MMFFALIDMCTMISGPFFMVFMREDLHFNYLIYNIIGSSGPLLHCQKYWQ